MNMRRLSGLRLCWLAALAILSNNSYADRTPASDETVANVSGAGRVVFPKIVGDEFDVYNYVGSITVENAEGEIGAKDKVDFAFFLTQIVFFEPVDKVEDARLPGGSPFMRLLRKNIPKLGELMQVDEKSGDQYFNAQKVAMFLLDGILATKQEGQVDQEPEKPENRAGG